jgi:fumarylpyruvate hydrolase
MNPLDDSGGDFVFAPGPRPSVPVRGEGRLFPVHRIYCVGQNYAAHAREMGASDRQPPFFFSKPPDAICRAGTVPFPARTAELHHEVELVVALGGGGSELRPEEALSTVFGYAVGVDLTRRDLQSDARQLGRPWTTAKAFDHSAPISEIRPVGEGGHPDRATISLAVNGQDRQCANTREMIWSVPEVLAELSRYVEIRPGDLVFTGTPAGVGRLEPGDFVECSVAGVGSLAFRMGPPPGD